MAEASFRLPPSLELNEGNIAENFKKWKRHLDIYMIASGIAEKEDARKAAETIIKAEKLRRKRKTQEEL